LKETWLFVSSSTEMYASFMGDRTSGTNLVSIVSIPFDLFIVLAHICSCLEFDLTLDVIPSV
jgi:hypothetical protein